MHTVRLLHLRPLEAAERITVLRSLGYRVLFDPVDGRDTLRRVWEVPPDAYLFDLTRVPSHMREIAIALRKRQSTRGVPMVFAGGDPTKVTALQAVLPDAAYVAWDEIGRALADAIARPPEAPVVPDSLFAGYSGTPLPKKLGIKTGATVALRDAPEGFRDLLGPLPEGAVLTDRPTGPSALVVWFVRWRSELERDLPEAVGTVGERGGLWIAWPKRASAVATDLTQQFVRQTGLAAGLVDYKVAAFDRTWSGLLFTRRRPS